MNRKYKNLSLYQKVKLKRMFRVIQGVNLPNADIDKFNDFVSFLWDILKSRPTK